MFPRAKQGSDAEALGWNKYHEMYKKNEEIKNKWKELFNVKSENNANQVDFFELAKLFKPTLTYSDFDKFIQHSDALMWGFIDKITKTSRDASNAKKEFINFLIGWY